MPDIQVANDHAPNKVFYVTYETEWGSGLLKSNYLFFKIVEGKVYEVLQTIEQHGEAYQMGRSKHITTRFTIDEGRLLFSYYYTYTALADYETNKIVDIVKGKAFIVYEWNEQEKKYIPQFNAETTREKLDMLEGKVVKNFTQVFEKELNETAKNGSEEQKNAVKLFLKTIKKD